MIRKPNTTKDRWYVVLEFVENAQEDEYTIITNLDKQQLVELATKILELQNND